MAHTQDISTTRALALLAELDALAIAYREAMLQAQRENTQKRIDELFPRRTVRP